MTDIGRNLIYHGCRHAQSVEGCPFCAGAAEIERLRDWISQNGEQENTCTYEVLTEVCKDCGCGRLNGID